MKICTDVSVVIEWFKKGEIKGRFALKLKDDVLDEKVSLICSEWVLLEVIRALTKIRYPEEKIKDTETFLLGLEAGGFVEIVNVSSVRKLASEIIYKLNLYASDAVILATALHKKVDLITEDEHLLKKRVVNYAKKNKLKILTLDQAIKM